MKNEKTRPFWVVTVNRYICDASYSGEELKEKHKFPSFRKFRFIRHLEELKYLPSREGITNEELVKSILS